MCAFRDVSGTSSLERPLQARLVPFTSRFVVRTQHGKPFR